MQYGVESVLSAIDVTDGLPRYQTGQPVSVVLVCRNRAQSLPYVVSALGRNTRRPDLVVLSDDNSTDDSPAVFLQLCKEKHLAHALALHDSDGMSFRLNTLRNDGIAHCEDGLVIILDADHVPARTHIEAHLNMHQCHQRGVLSTGPRLEYAFSDCSGPINFMWGHEPVFMLQAAADKPVPSWTTVLASNLGMVKQAFADLGGFDPLYDGHYGFDDVDFTYRAWQRGFFFAASFEAYVTHIPHPPFEKRTGDTNRRKFRKKHGFDLSYPGLVDALYRGGTWQSFYQALLMQQNVEGMKDFDSFAAQLTVVPMLDPDVVGAKILLRTLLRRMIRKLGIRLNE